jgi:allantoinase
VSSSYLRGQDLIDQIQSAPYSRDLIGYHGQPPQVKWPNQARVAVQFVLNYEEGGENHIEHGDLGSEQFLSDIIGAASFPPNICQWIRCMSMAHVQAFGVFIMSFNVVAYP